jgi:ATP-binding cassette, subfamily B (MDR/TAP), member 1
VDGSIPYNFDTCETYWDYVANDMRYESQQLTWYWTIVICGCLFGHVFLYYGFGTASERLSKRLRDQSFIPMLRQEVAYFDMRSVARITSQLQDDTSRIHAFTGEPVRALLTALAAIVTGISISLIVRNGHNINVAYSLVCLR